MAEHADTAADKATTATAPAGADDAPANSGLADGGDHDRVVMLSLNADGSHRQNRPEMIGDPKFAVAATKRQFAEQAVSAVDTQLRGVSDDEPGERDPDTLKAAHEAAQAAAHDRAEQTVAALHPGVGA